MIIPQLPRLCTNKHSGLASPQNHSVYFARADAIIAVMFGINSGCESVLQLLRYLIATKVVLDLLCLLI